ncbi:hypothetical protein [Argonema antarcticum]|uniref:hypothetical protein n=1 Tax=Argonema antarcticum TaxID=2942763 RepID=UPI0020118EE6|nr:hypothetical protein [Argonema antarcticum]MCL1469147.1 hypothetical protein [Argonema antarcticum A004/B2]
MLVRTILLPSVLKANPENQSVHYGMMIGLLQDLEKNGVVLLDETNCIKAALFQDIGNLPVKFRKKAEVLLKDLKKKNRFVELSLPDVFKPICKNKPCQQCIRIGKEYLPPAILVSYGCKECTETQLALFPSVEVIDVAEYRISNLFESHLKQVDRVFLNGESKQDKFEQEIFIPLFRDAKHIKIYDRWIGRSALQPPDIGQIGDNYKLTLEWIIDVFLRESRLGVSCVLEVYCGLDTRNICQAKIRTFVASLRQFESEMRHTHSFPNFKLIIKKETQANQMPHDRYLITNQVAISIARGFDLLLDKRKDPYPRRVRDVTIAYCSEAAKIEQAVRSLPDL